MIVNERDIKKVTEIYALMSNSKKENVESLVYEYKKFKGLLYTGERHDHELREAFEKELN